MLFRALYALSIGGIFMHAVNFENIADVSNYTYEDIRRWLGTEKHYSNNLKEQFFQLMSTQSYYGSSLYFPKISFSRPKGNPKGVFSLNSKCGKRDANAVILLSNFSINNNYSHFLHAILRLFCALVDSKWIEWDQIYKRFIRKIDYTIWLDESLRFTDKQLGWILMIGDKIRHLGTIKSGECIEATRLLYGSGCVRLLPPEKWFGYPGCRAREILPAFGYYMRQQSLSNGSSASSLSTNTTHAFLGDTAMVVTNNRKNSKTKSEDGRKRSGLESRFDLPDADQSSSKINIVFAVRTVGNLTGQRVVSNLEGTQKYLQKILRLGFHMSNVSFENLSPMQTINIMSRAHIFVSVHGAGMTNSFFMRSGSVVVEILPWPLCTCRSPDFFYGMAGFYHGTSLAIGARHLSYCVDQNSQVFQQQHLKGKDKPTHEPTATGKCSWRWLHIVQSITLDPVKVAALLRTAERELVASGAVVLSKSIVNLNPHANGR